MKLSFDDARLERGAARGKYDLLIGAIATFMISTRGRLIYGEEDFPIVELALALQGWSRESRSNGEPFEFCFP